MWKKFEKSCLNYLTESFKEQGVVFTSYGESDSTSSDIKAQYKENTFFFEVKKIPSQTSQFVVLPDTEKKLFYYSNNNKKNENEYHTQIIQHMNNNYDDFLSAGTKGKEVILNLDIFINLIIEDYKQKNIKFIIFNGMRIITIDKLADFFDISCSYRIKKSGSSSLSSMKSEKVQEQLKLDLRINKIERINKKLYVYSTSPLAKERFSVEQLNLIYSEKGDNKFEVRELSNTSNGNVIFKLRNKEKQPNALTLDQIFI